MELCVDEYMTLNKVTDTAINMQYLEPSWTQHQKSFYKKAKVYKMPNGSEVLVSYTTPVVLWNKVDGMIVKLQANDKRTCSSTTMRHINAFLESHGKPTKGVASWRKTTMI